MIVIYDDFHDWNSRLRERMNTRSNSLPPDRRAAIQRLVRQGVPLRQIARATGHSKNTVKKYKSTAS